MYTTEKPQFYYLKVGCKRVQFTGVRYPDDSLFFLTWKDSISAHKLKLNITIAL